MHTLGILMHPLLKAAFQDNGSYFVHSTLTMLWGTITSWRLGPVSTFSNNVYP